MAAGRCRLDGAPDGPKVVGDGRGDVERCISESSTSMAVPGGKEKMELAWLGGDGVPETEIPGQA